MNAAPVPLDQAHTVFGHWLGRPNIVTLDTAVKRVAGRETGRPAIVVGVIEKKSPASLTALDFPVPTTVEVDVTEPDGAVRHLSMPTDVIETGVIHARSLRWCERPCPGGFAINAVSPRAPGTLGTLGVTAYYRDRRSLLTNCHVIGEWAMWPGSDIYQPENRPGSTSEETFLIGVCDGTFEICTYAARNPANLEFNTYDFAWSHVPAELRLTSHAVYGIYTDGSTPLDIRREPERDEKVRWIGQQTGRVQESTITSLHFMSEHKVLGRYAYFQEALTVASGPNAILEGGDSGAALIAEKDNRVVGLMTASSDLKNGSQTVVATRIPEDDPVQGKHRQPMVLRPPVPPTRPLS